MIQLDVLIFDMDGVLIDVSASYRDAVRQTAQLYLEAVLGLPAYAGDLISREDVAAFKLAGGFNNDWDLTTGILKYFIAMLGARAERKPLPETMSESVAFLHQAGKQINTPVETLRRRKDIPSFADTLRTEGSGLAAVRKILGDRNDHLLFATGDLRRTNLVKRIFEEIYLGEELFRKEYGEDPLIYRGEGLIRRERLIPNLQSLSALGKRVALGIATGRPRNQATYALQSAGILNQFRSLVTLEDIVDAERQLVIASREAAKQSPSSDWEIASAQKTRFAMTSGAVLGQKFSLTKPHPFTLWEAVRRVTTKRVRCAYIGDTPDDIRAANTAKSEMDFVSIGCLASAEDKEALRREFERVGADIVVNRPDELVALVAKSPD